MRILITGAGGMLGSDVQRAGLAAGHELVALARSELDIADAAAVRMVVQGAQPDVVINCAAWTDVDGAESAPDAALAINGPAAGNVARAASEAGAWTIHVSSDYVFNGAKFAPYLESDPVYPLSAYGRSKLAGELAVAAAAPARHTIVRSSWLFGVDGRCFPATILGLAAQRDELTVVDDQIGCPTFTGHLAPALVALAAQRVPGLLHVTGEGYCSWYELAHDTVAAAGLECEVRPGKTADLARPAARPPYSVLASERGAPQLPHWFEGLSEFLRAKVPT
jgi:dTDP-4-dehydrorhamnose reductase